MKYAPHPWDKYGEPNLDSDNEVIDAVELAILEEEAEELRELVSRLESEIEDLESELSGAEMDLYAVEEKLGRASKVIPEGQTKHSDEY